MRTIGWRFEQKTTDEAKTSVANKNQTAVKPEHPVHLNDDAGKTIKLL